MLRFWLLTLCWKLFLNNLILIMCYPEITHYCVSEFIRKWLGKQKWRTLKSKAIICNMRYLKADYLSLYTGSYVLYYKAKMIHFTGFEGCLRQIRMQGTAIVPTEIINSDMVYGIKLDGCQIALNPCASGDLECENGGACAHESNGTKCICNSDEYTGTRCQVRK